NGTPMSGPVAPRASSARACAIASSGSRYSQASTLGSRSATRSRHARVTASHVTRPLRTAFVISTAVNSCIDASEVIPWPTRSVLPEQPPAAPHRALVGGETHHLPHRGGIGRDDGLSELLLERLGDVQRPEIRATDEDRLRVWLVDARDEGFDFFRLHRGMRL